MSATLLYFRRRQLFSSNCMASKSSKIVFYSATAIVILFPCISLADCPTPIITTVYGPCNVSVSGLTVNASGILDANTGQYAIDQTLAGGNINNNGSIISNYTNQSNPLIAIRNNAGTLSNIINQGAITASSRVIYAMGISNGTTINTLDNYGSITGQGITSSWGISNTGVFSAINNKSGGTITGTTSRNIHNSAGPGYGIGNSSSITTITNNGIISGSTTGIYSSSLIGTITNNNAIEGASTNIINNIRGIFNDTGSMGLTGGVVNTGTISGRANDYTRADIIGYGIDNSGSFGALTNSNTIDGYSSAWKAYGINNTNNMTSISNTGSIIGYGLQGRGIFNSGNIPSIINSGTIKGTSYVDPIGANNYGIGLENSSGTMALDNSGSILGVAQTGNVSYGIKNSGAGSAFSLTNTGTISGGTAGIYNLNTGSISSITNNGSITSGSGYGINNAGTITTLSNKQNGLTYTGALPTNYNEIINSVSSFGTFAATSVTGSMAFGIAAGSTVTPNTYNSLFTGVSSSNLTSLTGTYSGLNYSLVETVPSSSNIWNLVVVAPNCTGSGSQTLSAPCQNLSITTNSSTVVNNAGNTIYSSSGTSPVSISTTGITFTNNGNIIGNNANGISNTGTISALSNAGSITNTTSGNGINNAGIITTLNNTGTIANNAWGYGINNNGTITTLKNSQSNLTYAGVLPTTYNEIINSISSYGQLNVTGATGSMAFVVDPSSTVSAQTYSSVLRGFSSLAGITGTTGSYGGFNYQFIVNGANSSYWDLVFSSNALPGTTTDASSLTGNIALQGGTLVMNQPNTSYTYDFLVSNTASTINQDGNISTFSGVFSNAAGQSGNLTISNTGSGGKIIFTGPILIQALQRLRMVQM